MTWGEDGEEGLTSVLNLARGKSQNLLSMANFAKICKRDELKFGKGSTLGENSWKGVRKQPGIKGDVALKIKY